MSALKWAAAIAAGVGLVVLASGKKKPEKKELPAPTTTTEPPPTGSPGPAPPTVFVPPPPSPPPAFPTPPSAPTPFIPAPFSGAVEYIAEIDNRPTEECLTLGKAPGNFTIINPISAALVYDHERRRYDLRIKGFFLGGPPEAYNYFACISEKDGIDYTVFWVEKKEGVISIAVIQRNEVTVFLTNTYGKVGPKKSTKAVVIGEGNSVDVKMPERLEGGPVL